MPEPEPQTPEPPSIDVEQLRELREKAKRHDDAVAQAAAFQRELAFAKAGLPLDDKRLSYFVKGYEGEMTPESIRAAATEAGFLEAPKQPQVPEQERAAHERMEQASAGGQAAPPVDWNAEIAKAKDSNEVMAVLQRAQVPTVWDRN